METQSVITNTLHVENRGRKEIFDDNDRLVKLLIEIREDKATLTHFMKHKLKDHGFVTLTRTQPPGGGRGRPMEVPVLTGKAKSLIALTEYNWKRKKAA